jgi:hypothetical protein
MVLFPENKGTRKGEAFLDCHHVNVARDAILEMNHRVEV